MTHLICSLSLAGLIIAWGYFLTDEYLLHTYYYNSVTVNYSK